MENVFLGLGGDMSYQLQGCSVGKNNSRLGYDRRGKRHMNLNDNEELESTGYGI